MSHLFCCLCNENVGAAGFDLKHSFTATTNTSLLLFLKTCTTEEFNIANYLICDVCYLLLNELDNIRSRAKVIEDQLKKYLSKYVLNNREDIHVLDDNHKEEFKEQETSFDFVDINTISEINPSLSEEGTGKSVIKFDTSDAILQTNELKVIKDFKSLKPYSCSVCSKTWKTLTELKNHLATHNRYRPLFICEICGQAYKRQHALKIHIGMHQGINPFTCIYCKKSFTQKGALVRHMPIHTGELPYQCDLCGKRFVHHSSFNVHKLSHTGEKSYKCETCGLSLISTSHLKRHMRVHTGEKRFTCNTCGKKFGEKYNLVKHEQLHLGISKKKKIECQICHSICNDQVKLEEHLATVHQATDYFEKPIKLEKVITVRFHSDIKVP